MRKTDIVIIGAGIAGLTASIYLKRANQNFIVLENMLPGGKLNILKEVENYPGFSKCSGKDILFSLMNQIHQLGISIDYGSVQTILKDEYGFKVVTDKEILYSKAVILASGVNNPTSTIKGEEEYFGRGVSYCATCDGNFFKDQDVAVYGGSEVAIEEALYLSNLVKKLYFVVNEENIDNIKEFAVLKSKDNVHVLMNKKIIEICGDMLGVNKVIINDDTKLDVSGVFPYVGQKSSKEYLNNLHVEMENNLIVTNEKMETNIPGIYAIGDIRKKQLKQLVTAASDGAVCSVNAIKAL